MYINSPELNETDADDLFTRPPRSARRATPAPTPPRLVGRVACAVCGLRAEVLICKECAEQPEASRARVQGWLDANTRQQDAAAQPWLTLAAEHAGAYQRLLAARTRPDYAERCKAHRRAGNIYGTLLDAEAALDAALTPLRAERARLEKAERVLEGL